VNQLLRVFCVVLLLVSIPVTAEQQLRADVCGITRPNGVVPDVSASVIREVFGVSPIPAHLRQFPSHGNRWLSVAMFGLPGDAGTTGRLDPAIGDGWLRAKFGWMRAAKGPLRISGNRIDGDALPLRSRVPDGYGETGFQASGLFFSTPGCWQITAQIGDREDSKLTFVTRILAAP
jgi:hypothetical protein